MDDGHQPTIGTKLKDLATRKSHAERAEERAAKHKLVRLKVPAPAHDTLSRSFGFSACPLFLADG